MPIRRSVLRCGFIKLHFAAIGAALLFAAACTDSSGPAESDGAIVGVYYLVAVNGAPLPATMVVQGVTSKVNAGTLAMAGNGAFSLSTTFAAIVAGQPSTTTVCSGIWLGVLNTLLTFQTDASAGCKAGNTEGSFNGNTITITDGTLERAYRR